MANKAKKWAHRHRGSNCLYMHMNNEPIKKTVKKYVEERLKCNRCSAEDNHLAMISVRRMDVFLCEECCKLYYCQVQSREKQPP
jgi:hypothetical protein